MLRAMLQIFPHSVSHIKAPPPGVLGLLAASVLFGIFVAGSIAISCCYSRLCRFDLLGYVSSPGCIDQR